VHSLWAKKHSLECGRLWIVWEQMVCRPVSIGSQWKLNPPMGSTRPVNVTSPTTQKPPLSLHIEHSTNQHGCTNRQAGRQAGRRAGRQTDGESGRQTSMVTDAFSQGSACWTKHLKSASPIARKRNQKAHLVLLLRTLPHTNAVMTRQSRHSFLDSCTNTIHITLTLHRG